MRHGVDSVGLFEQTAHSPSYFELSRTGAGELVDFRIPCNPYFPTAEMFEELSKNLESVRKFYPNDSSEIAQRLSTVLGLDPATIAWSRREIVRFMAEPADLDLVVIDESFIDFVEGARDPSVAAEASIRPNVVVTVEGTRDFTQARWTTDHASHSSEPSLLMRSA